jgi:hypothetical protein
MARSRIHPFRLRHRRPAGRRSTTLASQEESNVRHPPDFDPTHRPSNHYDPRQPRVPAGHRDGGQWTDGKERELSKLRVAFNDRDPSVRTSPPQLPSPSHQPQIPSPPLQPQTPSPPPQPRLPSRQPMGLRGGPLWGLLGALAGRSEEQLLKRYNQFSEYNNGEQQAVLFLGREFGRDPDTGQFRLMDARMLTREEANKLCNDGINTLQKIIDEAVEETKLYRDRLSNNQYGNDVHSRVEGKIKDPGKNLENPDIKLKAKLKDIKAEFSLVKMDEEEANSIDRNNPPAYKDGKRGEKGSIRLDALQPILKRRTVCIHDLKTLRRGLSPARIKELADTVARNWDYRDVVRIIVTEARPSDGWRMGRRPKP